MPNKKKYPEGLQEWVISISIKSLWPIMWQRGDLKREQLLTPQTLGSGNQAKAAGGDITANNNQDQ